MAKLKSLLKIEGTLDGLTFYKGKDGYLVRTKGGVSKKRIQNDPAFARTRENGSEFGHVATSGKQLRRAIQEILADAKDSQVTARLTKVMSQIKNLDTVSVRGQRKVSEGLAATEGKEKLKAFDFNNRALLSAVLLSDIDLDSATGSITISNLVPNTNIVAPEGATHVSFSSAFLNLDFNTNDKDLKLSDVENIPINGTEVSFTLTPTDVPQGTGIAFYFLKIAFFQEVNAVQYPLNNGAFNVLQCIEVM